MYSREGAMRWERYSNHLDTLPQDDTPVLKTLSRNWTNELSAALEHMDSNDWITDSNESADSRLAITIIQADVEETFTIPS